MCVRVPTSLQVMLHGPFDGHVSIASGLGELIEVPVLLDRFEERHHLTSLRHNNTYFLCMYVTVRDERYIRNHENNYTTSYTSAIHTPLLLLILQLHNRSHTYTIHYGYLRRDRQLQCPLLIPTQQMRATQPNLRIFVPVANQLH